MFDLDKHREDFIKLTYDLLKIWLTLAIISPYALKKLDISDLLVNLLISLIIFLIGVLLREGGKER